MRILQISSAKTFGGGERHFVDLCRELENRGHEVYVAIRPTSEWQERLNFLPPERFLYVSIRNSFGMFSAKKIGRLIEKENIDIVHAHVARDYLAASIAVRSVKRSRLVLTRHVIFPLKPFHRLALKNVSAAIGVSPPVADQLARVFPAEKIRVIANGIIFADDNTNDGGAEFRLFHQIPADAPLVITVGELLPLKGQRDFVLAAGEILKRIPECRFVIAGKDNSMDRRFRRELKRLVKVLGFEEKVLWLDWLDDLGPLFAAADLFVSPSHSESFGLAILEAMAAGKAVIATETDGARGLIDDPNSLVPIKDPIALADKICRYLEDRPARDILGKRLAKIARERYGLSVMVDATIKLYAEIVSPK